MIDTVKEAGNELNRGEQHALLWDDLPMEVRAGLSALQDKKVEDLRVYDLREFTPFCDFVVIGTAFSSVQAGVVREELKKSLTSEGLRLYGIEGEDDSGWLLIDFWDIIVHIFKPETRRYYNLEALWADFPWWPGEDSD